MSINGIFNQYDGLRFGFEYADRIQKLRAVAPERNKLFTPNHRDRETPSIQYAMRMRKALEALMTMTNESEEIQRVSPASASSVASLGLDMTETSTTAQSTEEVNTTPTSYSTHGPEFTGSSTAQATISGEYDGSNGTDTLTYNVSMGGTHGTDKLKLMVVDSNNIAIDTINVNKNDAIDKQYSLSNGLVFTLGEGDLQVGSSFALNVFDSTGTAVDPDNPFNGSRLNDPNLEEGLSVTGGSFSINGTAIDVGASDSINTVLDRINQSDAGVTAAFDAAVEKVMLTQKTAGSAHGINLADDTSGFLAAVKLDPALPAIGEDPETEKPLAEVESFSSVQSGNIIVNSLSISIDVNTDSLSDVLDRISDSSADVSATFNSSSQRVNLNSEDPDSQMTLASGGTNFFAALGIADGTYNSENDLIRAGDIEVVDGSNLIAEYVKTYRTYNSAQNVEAQPAKTIDAEMAGTLVHIMAKSMNALFDDSAFSSPPTAKTEEIRNNVRSAISASFNSDGPQFKTDFGIHFNFQKTEKGVFNFSQADRRQFETALANPEGESAVRNALLGKEPGGLLQNLHAALTTGVPELASEVGTTGIFLDVTA